jgi:hypothetical protein
MWNVLGQVINHIMSHTQTLKKLKVLTRAWLNLWSKNMITGRINQFTWVPSTVKDCWDFNMFSVNVVETQDMTCFTCVSDFNFSSKSTTHVHLIILSSSSQQNRGSKHVISSKWTRMKSHDFNRIRCTLCDLHFASSCRLCDVATSLQVFRLVNLSCQSRCLFLSWVAWTLLRRNALRFTHSFMIWTLLQVQVTFVLAFVLLSSTLTKLVWRRLDIYCRVLHFH